MSSAKRNVIPDEKFELYQKLVATNSKVELKGATVPYTSLNGHMFSYMNSSGMLALKLPKEEIEKFLRKYKTKLFEAYGTTQKDFVTVPDQLLRKTKELSSYFDLSFKYVSSLKPKPTKRKA
jgi:hypothetical protein